MARKLSRREITLAVVLSGAGVWAIWTQATKEIDPGSSPTTAGKGGETAQLAAPAVRMDLLETRSEAFGGGGRDLFQYAVRPPSAAELRRRREEAERLARQAEIEAIARADAEKRRREQQQIMAEQTALNPPKPPAPPINLKYLGYFGPKEDKIAAFEDGEEVIVAKQGDVIKNLYRVVEIRYESVVMGYTNPQFRNDTRELAMAPAPVR